MKNLPVYNNKLLKIVKEDRIYFASPKLGQEKLYHLCFQSSIGFVRNKMKDKRYLLE
jgi:hypothetical protein